MYCSRVPNEILNTFRRLHAIQNGHIFAGRIWHVCCTPDTDNLDYYQQSAPLFWCYCFHVTWTNILGFCIICNYSSLSVECWFNLGIGKLSTADGKALADPDVLHRLTSTVSYALDEAAAALSRLRAETSSQGQLRWVIKVGSRLFCSFSILVLMCLVISMNRSLPEACSDGDVVRARELLKGGQSVHTTTEDGEPLLSLACSAGYYELAEVGVLSEYISCTLQWFFHYSSSHDCVNMRR